MSLVLKISFNDDIRRISLERTPNFAEILRIVQQLFGLSSDVQVKYEDDEKDLVTVTSDLELKEAVALASKSASSVLRLFVYEKPKVQESKGKAPETNTSAESSPKDFFQFLNPETLLATLTVTPENLADVSTLLQKLGVAGVGEKQPTDVLKFAKDCVSSVPWLQELLNNVIKGEETKANSSSSSDSNNNNNNANANSNPNSKCPWGGRGWGGRGRGGRHCGRDADGRNIHYGVVCDACEAAPIIGSRYKCTVCPDYDLCEKCYAKAAEVHDPTHPLDLWKGRFPRGPTEGGCFAGRTFPCNGSERKLSAYFVESVTVPDDSAIAPAAEFTKIWKVRNNGYGAWPESTVMSCIYGDRLDAPAAVMLPSSVAPGQEIDISVTMTAPSEVGKVANYWRLCGPNGVFFGPTFWARISVEKAAAAEPAAPAPAPVAQPEPAAPAPAPVAQPEPVVIAPPVVQQPEPVVAPVVAEPVAVVAQPEPAVVAQPEPVVAQMSAAESVAVGSMKAMGFEGDLLAVLRKNGGDLQSALNELLG